MGLPVDPIEWTTAVVADQEVKIRSISFAQAVEIGRLLEAGRNDEATIVGISYGTDTPIDDVRAWVAVTRPGVVEALSQAIADEGGLTEGASKSS